MKTIQLNGDRNIHVSTHMLLNKVSVCSWRVATNTVLDQIQVSKVSNRHSDKVLKVCMDVLGVLVLYKHFTVTTV